MTSQTIKNNIANVGKCIPLRLMMRLAGKTPPFMPFYHTVTNNKPEYIDNYHVRTVKQFEDELDFLLKHFEPVDLQTIISKPRKNQIHLTFDDGLKECSTIIAPLLIRKGIPATFFVSSKFTDNQALFHRFKQAILVNRNILSASERKKYFSESNALDELARQNNISFNNYLVTFSPYLTLDEIRGLKNQGFSIGSHSIDHPEFWVLSEDEQYRQVSESMDWVNAHFRPEIKAFSFPFTDDGISYKMFERLNVNNVVDVTFGTAGLKRDRVANHFQRVPIERTVNWPIKKVVHFEYFYYILRNLFSANTVKR